MSSRKLFREPKLLNMRGEIESLTYYPLTMLLYQCDDYVKERLKNFKYLQ